MAVPDLPVEISRLRIVAQGLVPATAAKTVTSATRSLLAVQGQQVTALPHALLSRTPSAFGSDVRAAFDTHQLIRSRPMRGTVHITAAQDYHWLRLTLNNLPSRYVQRLEAELGITAKVGQSAAKLARSLILDRGGRVSREDLFTAWITELCPVGWTKAEQRRWCNLLMWQMDRLGAVIEAPMGKNQHFFIDAQTLPAADSQESGFKLSVQDGGGIDVSTGLAEVARRYALGHGPVNVYDLARWAGINVSSAATALARAAREESRLGRFCLTGEHLVSAKVSETKNVRADVYYLRTDLPDLLSENRIQADQVMFLASFDELHVGYKNRSCLTDDAGERFICPSSNGMFRPLIIYKGRLVAVRPVSEGLIWVAKPGKRLESAVNVAVEKMSHRQNG